MYFIISYLQYIIHFIYLLDLNHSCDSSVLEGFHSWAWNSFDELHWYFHFDLSFNLTARRHFASYFMLVGHVHSDIVFMEFFIDMESNLEVWMWFLDLTFEISCNRSVGHTKDCFYSDAPESHCKESFNCVLSLQSQVLSRIELAE